MGALKILDRIPVLRFGVTSWRLSSQEIYGLNGMAQFNSRLCYARIYKYRIGCQ